jgi:hypothetical protein
MNRHISEYNKLREKLLPDELGISVYLLSDLER